MKSIIRRASHGRFNYRTTDPGGLQILWLRRPRFCRETALWGRTGVDDCKIIGHAQPPRNAPIAIVRIGK